MIARGGIVRARLGALLALVAGIWLVTGPFLHGIWSSESQVDRQRGLEASPALGRLVRRRRRRCRRPRLLCARAARQAALRRLGSRGGADDVPGRAGAGRDRAGAAGGRAGDRGDRVTNGAGAARGATDRAERVVGPAARGDGRDEQRDHARPPRRPAARRRALAGARARGALPRRAPPLPALARLPAVRTLRSRSGTRSRCSRTARPTTTAVAGSRCATLQRSGAPITALPIDDVELDEDGRALLVRLRVKIGADAGVAS